MRILEVCWNWVSGNPVPVGVIAKANSKNIFSHLYLETGVDLPDSGSESSSHDTGLANLFVS